MDMVIYTEIPQVDSRLIDDLKQYSTADLHEALGPVRGRMGLMHSGMRPLRGGVRIVGRAVTAFDCPGNNLMMHKALHLAEAGTVLVLTNGGAPQGALWGELAATFALRRGIAGVIADGNIRDTDILAEMSFPIWSTTISPLRADKRGGGAVNVPIFCGGVLVHPGDVIVADGDGVLAIRPNDIAAALKGAAKRKAREAELRVKLADGSSLFDLLGMQALVDAAGVEERKGVWTPDDGAA